MPNIMPYSNFHELNLDWILAKMKELEQAVADIQASATPSTSVPLMDGIGSVGMESNFARGDHVHPTDTSRASASDLTNLDTREYNDYVQLQGDINTVDAKIAFSSEAPQMDDVASPGSSFYQARADHVHPTDTSRASQTQVDSLQARVDAFSGSANPSDTTPQMDGVGSAGTGGNYSRGDHVHPSDTSKLDVAGGTITGDLDVNGAFNNPHTQMNATSNAIGWLRVATIPYAPGTSVEIEISKVGSTTPAETHSIRLDIYSGQYSFNNEHSIGTTRIIDKIRYSDAGKLDVHFDQNYSVNFEICIKPFAPTKAEKDAVEVLASPEAVLDVPVGETILAIYSFMQSMYSTTTMTSDHTINYQRCETFSIGDAFLTMVDAVVTLTTATSFGDTILSGLPPMLFYGWSVPIMSSSPYCQIAGNGSSAWITAPALSNGTTIRIHTLYISH